MVGAQPPRYVELATRSTVTGSNQNGTLVFLSEAKGFSGLSAFPIWITLAYICRQPKRRGA